MSKQDRQEHSSYDTCISEWECDNAHQTRQGESCRSNKIVENREDDREADEDGEYGPSPLHLPILASSDKEENRRKECEENIGDIRELAGLVLLECDIGRELEIVVEPAFLTKIPRKVFILTFAITRDTRCLLSLFLRCVVRSRVDSRVVVEL